MPTETASNPHRASPPLSAGLRVGSQAVQLCADGDVVWAWPLGELASARAVGCDFAAATAPALWSAEHGGLWLDWGAPGALSATQQLQASAALELCVLQVMQAMPSRRAIALVFDSGIRKRFASLAGLQGCGAYRVHHGSDGFRKGFDEVLAEARERHHDLLGPHAATVGAFNRTAKRPKMHWLVLVNVSDVCDHPHAATALIELLPQAHAAGMHVLAYGSLAGGASSRGAAGTDASATLGRALAQALAAQSPRLQLGEGNAMQASGPGTQDMYGVINRYGLALPSTDHALERAAAIAADCAKRLIDQPVAGGAQDFLAVPVGTTADGRSAVVWRMGEACGSLCGVMTGMPGMGKSTLLNNLILGIGDQYTAHEVQLVLMDYKDGVEFQAFVDHPNVARIFLDNTDTQAAVDLLNEFSQTIGLRNERFGKAGVKNIDAFNDMYPSERLPRLLLVIDEFQQLCSGFDAQSLKIMAQLIDVSKRGRSAGVHMVLSTQSLGGIQSCGTLMKAFSLRVSFKVNNEHDSELVMSGGNRAAMRLEKYEFVLNTDSGASAANTRAMSDPPADAAQRIAHMRSKRAVEDCVSAIVIKRADPAGQVAPSAPTSVDAVTAPMSPSPPREQRSVDADHEANLQATYAKLARLGAALPADLSLRANLSPSTNSTQTPTPNI